MIKIIMALALAMSLNAMTIAQYEHVSHIRDGKMSAVEIETIKKAKVMLKQMLKQMLKDLNQPDDGLIKSLLKDNK